jgi:hypothetical protein
MVHIVYGMTPFVPYELLIIITISCIFIFIVVFQLRYLNMRKEDLLENIKRHLRLQISLSKVKVEKHYQLKSKKKDPEDQVHEILISNESNELKIYQKYIDNDSLLNRLGIRELEHIKRQLDTIRFTYDLKTHLSSRVSEEIRIDDYDNKQTRNE